MHRWLLCIALLAALVRAGDPPPWYHPGIPWWINEKHLPDDVPELYSIGGYRPPPLRQNMAYAVASVARPPSYPKMTVRKDPMSDPLFDAISKAKAEGGKGGDGDPIVTGLDDPIMAKLQAASLLQLRAATAWQWALHAHAQAQAQAQAQAYLQAYVHAQAYARAVYGMQMGWMR
eukprot:PLAT4274.1.p2 GENE.PLAT4274.1~~PLAT4274.1.p2  ORF type:complete len:183 (+),score=26.22 PLAT4274.1:27-551(+)